MNYSPVWESSATESLWNEWVVGGDFEGLVFRDGIGGFARMKKRVTMEYILMRVEESTADKYKAGGYAKALVGGLFENGKLVEKVSISGLTDTQRRDFFMRRKVLVGSVFEASGKGIFKSGALRHPSFERMRSDKEPEECTWATGFPVTSQQKELF